MLAPLPLPAGSPTVINQLHSSTKGRQPSMQLFPPCPSPAPTSSFTQPLCGKGQRRRKGQCPREQSVYWAYGGRGAGSSRQRHRRACVLQQRGGADSPKTLSVLEVIRAILGPGGPQGFRGAVVDTQWTHCPGRLTPSFHPPDSGGSALGTGYLRHTVSSAAPRPASPHWPLHPRLSSVEKR